MKEIKEKRIIICSIILILLCFSVSLFQKPEPNITVYSNDNSFSIEIPHNISFKINKQDREEYPLDLYSISDQMILYSNILPKNNYDLFEIVNNDKDEIAKSIDQIRDLSITKKVELKDYEAYEYSYMYTNTDMNTNFHVCVVWIKAAHFIYILNLEVIETNKEKYIDIFNQIVQSFTETDQSISIPTGQ